MILSSLRKAEPGVSNPLACVFEGAVVYAPFLHDTTRKMGSAEVMISRP
jgi:hypothetical protein